MSKSWLAAVAASSLTIGGILLGSCGGTTIIDPGAGGAAPGTTTSTGNGGASTTTSTSTAGGNGAGGGSVGSKCEQVCAIFEQCGMPEPGCVEECSTAASPECAAVFGTYLDCLLAYLTPPVCEMPVQCEAADDAWNKCEDDVPPPPCGPMDCYGGQGSCSCTVVCADGTYSTECKSDPGSSSCDCFINGQHVASCGISGPGQQPCDVYDGCCAPMFFEGDK